MSKPERDQLAADLAHAMGVPPIKPKPLPERCVIPRHDLAWLLAHASDFESTEQASRLHDLLARAIPQAEPGATESKPLTRADLIAAAEFLGVTVHRTQLPVAKDEHEVKPCTEHHPHRTWLHEAHDWLAHAVPGDPKTTVVATFRCPGIQRRPSLRGPSPTGIWLDEAQGIVQTCTNECEYDHHTCCAAYDCCEHHLCEGL